MFYTLALPVLFFVIQSVTAQGQCSRTYTVQEGDICDSISAQNNVSTYQLAVVNDGVINPECSNLEPNQDICLGLLGSDCEETHVVQPGDTCDGVAAGYNTNITMLYGNNPQLNWDCTNLYIGEVVCIASTIIVPPAPSGAIPGSVIPPTSTPALPWCD